MASISSGEWEYTFDTIQGFERTVLPEIDDDLLMELLDETGPVDDNDDDRLGCVMRSLEAELAHVGNVGLDGDHPGEDCEDCSMEDILSDLDDCSKSAYNSEEDPFGWVETGVGHPGGWYDVDDESMGFGDMKDYHVVNYVEANLMEQEYVSLWQ